MVANCYTNLLCEYFASAVYLFFSLEEIETVRVYYTKMMSNHTFRPARVKGIHKVTCHCILCPDCFLKRLFNSK